jgi:cytochrome oxidase Cu insertion factor (SCO1/SenC/PrrC family)
MQNRFIHSSIAVGISLAFFVTLGCSGANHGTVPVQITVTHKGAPVADAVVTFISQDGRAASGTSNASGVATLATTEGFQGVFPGEYSVSVVKMVTTIVPAAPTADDPERTTTSVTEHFLPRKYANPATSGLTQTIALDTRTIQIDLTD